ncbi:hypothetical protein AA11237_2523 [Acidocella aminolytica 101 = DSM 11237]|jgi:hypothetical protein|nr:hypothetical protein AA11237_2523 [Acidocella aminolytica 101 = DSM 11237]
MRHLEKAVFRHHWPYADLIEQNIVAGISRQTDNTPSIKLLSAYMSFSWPEFELTEARITISLCIRIKFKQMPGVRACSKGNDGKGVAER